MLLCEPPSSLYFLRHSLTQLPRLALSCHPHASLLDVRISGCFTVPGWGRLRYWRSLCHCVSMWNTPKRPRRRPWQLMLRHALIFAHIHKAYPPPHFFETSSHYEHSLDWLQTHNPSASVSLVNRLLIGIQLQPHRTD